MNRPLNVRQERFCEFVAAGESQTDAYLLAGFKVSREVARKHAARMVANGDISGRIAELRKPQTKAALRRKEENLRFLAALIETPISQIGPDSPLCAEYTEDVLVGAKRGRGKPDETVIRRRVRKFDPLRAIELYSKLLGHFEPDRVEVDAIPSTLLSIKQRAEQVVSALARTYGQHTSESVAES